MMRLRTLLAIAMMCIAGTLSAQEGMFGYIDFNGTLKLMPEYAEAQKDLQQTQSEYREEIERSKREFERQYIEFMLEQDHLSASIVTKRQKELQLLMDNNAQFKEKVQTELESKREELLRPLKQKLMEAVAKVCSDKGLDYVVDTGTGTYLYINQERGVDISDQVYSILRINKELVKSVESGQPVIK